MVFGSSDIVLSEAFHAIRAAFLPNEQRFRTVNHVHKPLFAEQRKSLARVLGLPQHDIGHVAFEDIQILSSNGGQHE